MRVIYGCFTGAHLSLFAAAFHLGWFDDNYDLQQCRKRINQLNFLNKRAISEPYLCGIDEYGREVYTVGLTPDRQVFANAINSLFSLYNQNGQHYHLVDTCDYGGKIAALGSKIRKFQILRDWGDSLLDTGVAWNLDALAKLVEETKAALVSIEKLANQN